jgi:manganese-dependent ADP-ribose/CDP-alcohol diphosphatase
MGNYVSSKKNLKDESSSAKDLKPICIFGCLSDIQYANCDDMHHNYKKSRYYRNSVNLVRGAIDDWKKIEKYEGLKLSFILQLGDLIDGKCKSNGDSVESMNMVLNELNNMFTQEEKSSSQKILNVWGNHEMYNFTRSYLVNTQLNTARLLNQNLNSNANYYSVKITNNLKLICLDLYEISILGYQENQQMFDVSLNMLREINHNKDLNSGNGLPKYFKQYVAYNGTISKKQYNWLENELKQCEENGSKAIVCGHIPLHHRASNFKSKAWNSNEIIQLLRSFNGLVLAYLAGHCHDGGYFKDKSNIHHLTLNAIVETHPSSNSYATFRVFNDRIKVDGVGKIPKFEIKL